MKSSLLESSCFTIQTRRGLTIQLLRISSLDFEDVSLTPSSCSSRFLLLLTLRVSSSAMRWVFLPLALAEARTETTFERNLSFYAGRERFATGKSRFYVRLRRLGAEMTTTGWGLIFYAFSLESEQGPECGCLWESFAVMLPTFPDFPSAWLAILEIDKVKKWSWGGESNLMTGRFFHLKSNLNIKRTFCYRLAVITTSNMRKYWSIKKDSICFILERYRCWWWFVVLRGKLQHFSIWCVVKLASRRWCLVSLIDNTSQTSKHVFLWLVFLPPFVHQVELFWSQLSC